MRYDQVYSQPIEGGSGRLLFQNIQYNNYYAGESYATIAAGSTDRVRSNKMNGRLRNAIGSEVSEDFKIIFHFLLCVP